MTRFRSTCADCHHVVLLAADEVSLIRSGNVTTYGFRCPLCACHTIRVPSTETLQQLRAVGLTPRWFIPPPRPVAPPLTEDDLIAFGRYLEAAPSAP